MRSAGRAHDPLTAWWVGFGGLAASVVTVASLGAFADARAAVLLAWLGGQAVWLALWQRADRAPCGARAVFLGALLLRLVALSSDLRLSDDVYRYVWEGERLASGASPWAAAPADPRFAAERAASPELAARINHPEVSAAYPPLYVGANAVIATCARGLPSGAFASELERSVFGFRLAATLADLAVVAALLGLLRRRGAPAARAIAWAWCPLVAFEFAGSAHLDALALAAWLGGLAWLVHAAHSERTRNSSQTWGAWAWVGVAAAIKFLPAVSACFGARARRSFAPLALLLGVVLVSGSVFLVLSDGASGALRGLSEYSFRWETPNLVHRFVEGAFARLTEYDEGLADPRRLARALLGLAWLGFGAWLCVRRTDVVLASGRMVGAFLVLTPTLHPWYAVWILPFLALEPRRSWAVLITVLPLAYWPLADWQHERVWREPLWLWPALALPFFALRVLEARAPRT
ncbi:MAG: hypothetical protein L6Q99_09985 [Planctomycetes bacterium]|nr:hypothetical protein [Planctomycetota bacterium]